ncbi:hypothetical protein WA026_016011 [Henosepilachna vigintioctopunctata]|uniref:Uncharacterized protein n=1 Tax=Henosepilachna vigintioctopunctata TaxID=420089 RepID=A0AAW1U8H2_9CUCU
MYNKNCISVLCLILLSLGAVLIALKGNLYSTVYVLYLPSNPGLRCSNRGPRRTFHFCKEESVHDLDFNLTIPNPVAMSIAHKARDWSFFGQKAISWA